MKNEIRILLLEDSATDAGLVRHTLRQGGLAFSLEHVDNKTDFIQALEKSSPDLILSDNPSRSPFGRGYVEHFDLFPDLLRYIDDGVLVLSVLPPGTAVAPEHARRRQEFYGTVDPSVDEAAAVYLEHLAAAGLHSPKYHYTYRNAGLGYLAFVCRR